MHALQLFGLLNETSFNMHMQYRNICCAYFDRNVFSQLVAADAGSITKGTRAAPISPKHADIAKAFSCLCIVVVSSCIVSECVHSMIQVTVSGCIANRGSQYHNLHGVLHVNTTLPYCYILSCVRA